jgi:hypothetical protein
VIDSGEPVDSIVAVTQTILLTRGDMMKKFNVNGQWNLRYLRSQLANAGKVSVYKCGSNWIISKYVETVGAWVQKPAPYHCDERGALCLALGLDDYPAK